MLLGLVNQNDCEMNQIGGSMATATQERGSVRWIEDRFKKGIPSDQFAQLFELDDGQKINLWDVWVKGQPPRIDEFKVAYFVNTRELGSVIDRLFKTYEGIPLRVLIRGQPPRLNMTEVEFQTPGF
jgi:hypothetical protein